MAIKKNNNILRLHTTLVGNNHSFVTHRTQYFVDRLRSMRTCGLSASLGSTQSSSEANNGRPYTHKDLVSGKRVVWARGLLFLLVFMLFGHVGNVQLTILWSGSVSGFRICPPRVHDIHTHKHKHKHLFTHTYAHTHTHTHAYTQTQTHTHTQTQTQTHT